MHTQEQLDQWAFDDMMASVDKLDEDLNQWDFMEEDTAWDAYEDALRWADLGGE